MLVRLVFGRKCWGGLALIMRHAPATHIRKKAEPRSGRRLHFPELVLVRRKTPDEPQGRRFGSKDVFGKVEETNQVRLSGSSHEHADDIISGVAVPPFTSSKKTARESNAQ